MKDQEKKDLKILDKIIKGSEALGIVRVLDGCEGGDLGGLERDMVGSELDLELLSAADVLLGPVRVVFLHDLRLFDDPLDLCCQQGR